MEWTIVNYDSLMDNIKRIHFIGIGGSGMCPLAEILHHEGYELSGSDMNEGETLDRIKGYGIPVFMGHAAENIKGAELVVYSAAIKETNPERQAAKELGIPCIERSVMLGIVTRRYRRSIAVSGTHGKTTTTAMLSQVLIGSGFDPSAIIGGKLPFIGGNSYVGHSDIIVCEACEYVDTFLQLNPFISIILNIDADHLDYFKNLDNIKKSFNKFAHQTTGLLVINGDDENTLDAVRMLRLRKSPTVLAKTAITEMKTSAQTRVFTSSLTFTIRVRSSHRLSLSFPESTTFIMHLPLRLLHIILALLRRKFPRIFTSLAVFTEDLKFSAHLTELLLPMTLLIIPQNLLQHSMPQ